MQAKGRVFKYGDNVDTDVIIPARYLNATDGMELAKHCMEDIDKEFVNKVKKGDIIEKLDGQKVTGNQDLVEKLQYYEAGETVEVVVARADDGEYKDITMEVTLGTRPQE